MWYALFFEVKTMCKRTLVTQTGSSTSCPHNVPTTTSFTSPSPPTTSVTVARAPVASVGEAPATAPPSETLVASVGEAPSESGLKRSSTVWEYFIEYDKLEKKKR